MVDVCRESEACIGTALISRDNELASVNLELNERQTRGLVRLRVGFAQEEDIVLGGALLPIYALDQR